MLRNVINASTETFSRFSCRSEFRNIMLSPFRVTVMISGVVVVLKKYMLKQ